MSAAPQRMRGQLRAVTCSDCEKLQRKLETAILDLENAEISLRAERAKVRRWKKMVEEKQHASPHFSTAERLFHWWQDCTGHDRAELDPHRVQACLNALKRYTERELALAIKGNAVNGFTDPGTKVKYDQFGTILRNADNIEKNISRYKAWCEMNRITFNRGPSLAELKAQEKAKR